MSGNRGRVRLQHRTRYKEIEVDLSGRLGMCILTWVKFCLFSRRKIILQISIVNHSGWPWPIQLQFWKGSSQCLSDVCLSWLRMQKMHFKTVSPSSNCRLRPKVAGDVFPIFLVGSANEKRCWKLVWTFGKKFQTFPKWVLGGPMEPKRRGVPTTYYVVVRLWSKNA
jgi:hypothetical protein